ncbi:MAG: fimbria/pilus outer membrane usher protein [Deltaproteobacteria bacterium]
MAPPSGAAKASSGPGGRVQRAFFDLRVNTVRQGETMVLLGGDDVWVAVEVLREAGLHDFQGQRRSQDGKDFVSLRSLAPDLTFKLDDRALRLELMAGPALLPTGRLEIGQGRPPNTIMGNLTSAFLNYSAQVNLEGKPSGFGELGVSSGPALFTTALSVDSTGMANRGISAIIYDILPRLETVTAGDAIITSDIIGSSGVVGGLTWARNFRLDPYFVVAPRPSFTTFVSTPSTVEVWVNSVKVRQEQVPSGTLDLANLPVVSGASDVRTVIRDSFGREQIYDLRTNLNPSLLAEGLTDFSYTLGWVRQDVATSSWSYTRPAALGKQRFGLNSWLTLGGILEASLDRGMVGPTVTFGTPIGQVDAIVAGSVTQGLLGSSWSLGWSWGGREWGGLIRYRGQTDSFATVILDPWNDRATADLYANFTASPLMGWTFGLDVLGSHFRDSGESASGTLRASYYIGAGLTAMGSLTQVIGGSQPGPSGQVNLTWYVGESITVSGAAGGGAQGAIANVGVSRPLPIGPGFGFQAQGNLLAGNAMATGLLQYQTGFGRYEAQYEQNGSSASGSVRASGGLVFAGSRFFFTRPIEEGYALARVGAPGVTTYLEGWRAGVSDEDGEILIPNLLARYSSRISIRQEDIPMNYEVGKLQKMASPFWKGGVLVPFDVMPVRAVRGRLMVNGDQKQPVARGELVMEQNGTEVRVPTSGEGKFFIERVIHGRYPVEGIWKGGRCRAVIEIPDKVGILDLGQIACEFIPGSAPEAPPPPPPKKDPPASSAPASPSPTSR